jgi:hypothetical protein
MIISVKQQNPKMNKAKSVFYPKDYTFFSESNKTCCLPFYLRFGEVLSVCILYELQKLWHFIYVWKWEYFLSYSWKMCFASPLKQGSFPWLEKSIIFCSLFSIKDFVSYGNNGYQVTVRKEWEPLVF